QPAVGPAPGSAAAARPAAADHRRWLPAAHDGSGRRGRRGRRCRRGTPLAQSSIRLLALTQCHCRSYVERMSMTVPQGAAVSIGAVLGTGVIALPALAAQTAGPASPVAWLALILLSAPLAWTFASLGARYPDAGGLSTYVRNAFGGRAAA